MTALRIINKANNKKELIYLHLCADMNTIECHATVASRLHQVDLSGCGPGSVSVVRWHQPDSYQKKNKINISTQICCLESLTSTHFLDLEIFVLNLEWNYISRF